MKTDLKQLFWRIGQSWWILLTFTLLFNWIAFFYIARRARNRRWALWGLIYAIPFMLIMSEVAPLDSWLNDIVMYVAILGGISSIVHAFKVRKEYLLRLEARHLATFQEDALMKRRVETEFGVKLPSASATRRIPAEEPLPPQEQHVSAISAVPEQGVTNTTKTMGAAEISRSWEKSEQEAIELNTATENELAGLPGIGIILAKKAIQLRQTSGNFRSVDDFFERLELKPRVVVRLRPLVTIRSPESLSPEPASTRKGRVVDY